MIDDPDLPPEPYEPAVDAAPPRSAAEGYPARVSDDFEHVVATGAVPTVVPPAAVDEPLIVRDLQNTAEASGVFVATTERGTSSALDSAAPTPVEEDGAAPAAVPDPPAESGQARAVPDPPARLVPPVQERDASADLVAERGPEKVAADDAERAVTAGTPELAPGRVEQLEARAVARSVELQKPRLNRAARREAARAERAAQARANRKGTAARSAAQPLAGGRGSPTEPTATAAGAMQASESVEPVDERPQHAGTVVGGLADIPAPLEPGAESAEGPSSAPVDSEDAVRAQDGGLRAIGEAPALPEESTDDEEAGPSGGEAPLSESLSETDPGGLAPDEDRVRPQAEADVAHPLEDPAWPRRAAREDRHDDEPVRPEPLALEAEPEHPVADGTDAVPYLRPAPAWFAEGPLDEQPAEPELLTAEDEASPLDVQAEVPPEAQEETATPPAGESALAGGAPRLGDDAVEAVPAADEPGIAAASPDRNGDDGLPAGSAPTLLVVSRTNVCRSPLVERVLGHALATGPFRDVVVMSAGTEAAVGAPMCEVSAGMFGSQDADSPAEHRARQLEPEEIQAADLVLTADRDLRSAVVRMAPGTQAKVFTWREAVGLSGVAEQRIRDGIVEPARALPDVARLLHAMRGQVVLDLPEERRGFFLRRRPLREPEDPLSVPDGHDHGADPREHARVTAQAADVATRLGERLIALATLAATPTS